jgi:RimJ/RimL family protein N-acetyltransferase
MTIRFRPVTLDDAQLLLEWRSSPRVNDMMFTDVGDIDIAQQRRWLERCEARDDFVHFIIEGDGEPAGYLAYSEIDRVNGRCSCGSYFGTAEAARKYGGFMHAYFMDYMFYVLGMRKNVIQIIDANQRVIRLQRLLGMREVGVLKEHIIKHGVLRDVYVFEILKTDWEAHRWNTNTIADSLKAFGVQEAT